MHKPLATLKNIKPMKTIMYFMIFCCMAACSSAGGGIITFCCPMNSTMVKMGKRLKYGPSPNMPCPLLTNAGMNLLQSKSMSGAARFEHQRIELEISGASRSSIATMSDRYSPMNTGIWMKIGRQPLNGL